MHCATDNWAAMNSPPMTQPVEDAVKNNDERMKKIMCRDGNEVCADCNSPKPLWASFLKLREDTMEDVAALCCTRCAQIHHFELGSDRCKIKYTKMTHEWTNENFVTLERSGNIIVNNKYEANLKEGAYDKDLVLEDSDEELERRAKFIKSKYKKLKYCRQNEKESAPAGQINRPYVAKSW